LSSSVSVEDETLERILIVQSLLDHDKRLKNIEQKLNRIMKEMSLLGEAFEEQQEDTSVSPKPNDEVTAESVLTYIQTLSKMLDRLKDKKNKSL